MAKLKFSLCPTISYDFLRFPTISYDFLRFLEWIDSAAAAALEPSCHNGGIQFPTIFRVAFTHHLLFNITNKKQIIICFEWLSPFTPQKYQQNFVILIFFTNYFKTLMMKQFSLPLDVCQENGTVYPNKCKNAC